jgi:hypothetical protein
MEVMLLNAIHAESDKIKENMPPEPTKNRIRYLERWAQKQDANYESPTDEW